MVIFQLTTSRRGRQEREIKTDVPVVFNSRPHAEVDYHSMSGMSTLFFSTHDLTQRSRRKGGYVKRKYIFQLTTSRRGRHRHTITVTITITIIFQLTTSRRGRQSFLSPAVAPAHFQLTTSRRGRLRRQPSYFLIIPFQLTTSRRGRL